MNFFKKIFKRSLDKALSIFLGDWQTTHVGKIVDELHAHNTWDVLETATGSRRQSIVIAISTAGVDQARICHEQYEYLTRILKGTISDDSYFGIIYEIDDEDDWQDEICWGKSNPNLGINVKIDDLRHKKTKSI